MPPSRAGRLGPDRRSARLGAEEESPPTLERPLAPPPDEPGLPVLAGRSEPEASVFGWLPAALPGLALIGEEGSALLRPAAGGWPRLGSFSPGPPANGSAIEPSAAAASPPL
ncbi:MAG: hypothetical protein AAF907_15715, partial [Planctomycetota bacterium]